MSQVGQNWASESRFSFSFQISPTILAQNVDQSLATKLGPDFSLDILTKLQLQNPNWTSTSKSWPNLSLDILNNILRQNLKQTVANTFLIINISNSNYIIKFWFGIFIRQGHIRSVSTTLVSELLRRVADDRTWFRSKVTQHLLGLSKRTEMNNFIIETLACKKRKRSWEDSNLQSPDPKSGALSIRPHDLA